MSDSIKKNIELEFERLYLEKYPDKKLNDYQYYYLVKMIKEAIHNGIVADAKEEMLKEKNGPLLTLMHDTAHDFDQMDNAIKIMSKEFKEIKATTKCYVGIEYIKSASESIKNQLDELYLKYR